MALLHPRRAAFPLVLGFATLLSSFTAGERPFPYTSPHLCAAAVHVCWKVEAILRQRWEDVKRIGIANRAIASKFKDCL